MRFPGGAGGTAAFLAILVGCGLPADQSGAVRVEVEAPPELYVGDTARLRGVVVDARGAPVPNAAVRFVGGSEGAVLVLPEGTVVAVAEGSATILALAADYADVATAVPIAVRTGLRLDSVRPATLRFGDTLQLYGIGLNPSVVTVRFGALAAAVRSFTPASVHSRNGPAVLTVWAPPPATTPATVSVAGERGVVVAATPVTVLQRDLFEPNDSVPFHLGALEDSLYNPALAIEASTAAAYFPRDWYTFDNPRTQDVTVSGAFLADSLTWTGGDRFPEPGRWLIGSSELPGSTFVFAGHLCGAGSLMFGGQAGTVPLRALPPGRYHLLVITPGQSRAARPYALKVVRGYRSELAPDAAEENDYCTAAYPLPLPGTLDNLNIDAPGDVDWYRFTVAGDPAGITVGVVTSDTTVELAADILTEAGVNIGFGSFSPAYNELRVNLPAGQYLLAISPLFSLTTTRYRVVTRVGAPFDSSALRVSRP